MPKNQDTRGGALKSNFTDAIIPDSIKGGGGSAGGPSNFKPMFQDAVHTEPEPKGDWGGEVNGDTSFQGAVKGSGGRVDEVTYVDVPSAPAAGGKAVGDSSVVANKKVKPDLMPL